MKIQVKNIKISKERQKGFTLVELVVVMAVFLFVIGAAVTIFISIVRHQKTVLSEEQLLNQISYVEEYMSKALRMARIDITGNCLIDQTSVGGGIAHPGYIYLLTRYDDAGIFKGIKFINASNNNACQEFFLDDTTDPEHPVLKELINSIDDNYAVALTPDSLQFEVVNPIRFSINGSDGSVTGMGCSDKPDDCGATAIDGIQPKVTVLLRVSLPGESTPRTIQTTVSQRNLNVR